MSDNNNPNFDSSKKGLPGSFLLFLLLAVLAVFTVQNFLSTKSGKVDNAYQLEHLVNLDLIIPDKSRKTALSDNLVNFSGQFRSELTEEGIKRYKYLELLNQFHELQRDKKELVEDLNDKREEIYTATESFLLASGISIPEGGYIVFDRFLDYPGQTNHVILDRLPKKVGPNLQELSNEFSKLESVKDNETALKQFGSQLEKMVRSFQSPLIGIGAKELKAELKSISSQINLANLPFKKADEKKLLFKEVLAGLSKMVQSLNEVEDTTRLNQLRSVRAYKKFIGDYQVLLEALQENKQQLAKIYPSVTQITWFVNDQELSTKALEKMNSESYQRWFNKASSEWHGFHVNKATVFKSPDQPRNQILEKFFRSEEPAPKYFHYLFTVVLPIFLVIFLLYFVFARQMKGVGSSAMNFGKSPARLMSADKNKITFKDVAGIDEAREELEEIVEFLKSPIKFTRLGGRIPKGVLCVGPPGTGKTLVARAVAGEANRPFFSIAGSDFVEMFVGVGASRIRDMFDQAKKSAPCIIFIDEIDAVGRHRGAGIGGGHDEREQTLNQLLVEMDGFDSNEGVILMAATNRPDVLDKALLRPGRFDRRVLIDLPDLKGRHDILKVHARKIKLAQDVNLLDLARGTPGCSGAELENILNESALIAARKGRSMVTQQEAMAAVDKVKYGKERRSLELDEKEKRTTAIHEAGHAVVACIVENWEPVDKVTIVPRTYSLGATHFLPKKNRLSYWKKELKDQLAVLMGGRVAELKFVGDLSSGAQQDIEQASELARNMVCRWGMSKELGSIAYEEKQEATYSMQGSRSKNYSESTAQSIDREVKEIINASNQRATDILETHSKEVLLMTDMLMEFETLDKTDLKHIMEGTWNVDEKRERLRQQLEMYKADHDEPPPIPEEVLS
ncbi:MAG: ATP-dependent zinc metalloprotease FtsH [Chlamydiales bacterium]|nr:ATP-dependent zinc metalloprotease FtsH [Chlamydiales bacterium]